MQLGSGMVNGAARDDGGRPGMHARLKAAQHACGKHHHQPKHGLRCYGAHERSSCRLCALAPQRRSEAKAVDGRKPEQEGKERRLEEKHPAIGGCQSAQPRRHREPSPGNRRFPRTDER